MSFSKSQYNVIGAMSGTSCDGLDLCYVKFTFDKKWNYKIIVSQTIPYNKSWEFKLKSAITLSSNKLKEFDNKYTELLCYLIEKFVDKNKIEKIDAICSHGHTVFHAPNLGYTFQLGNVKEILEKTKYKWVCDFRKQDVLLGGQGAPLVPIGDSLLFPEYDCCLNLGGFANISTTKLNSVLAYDVCPVNIVLNYYSNLLDMNFDKDGLISKTGSVNQDLLTVLNSNSFYLEKPPKSLGLEWVNKNVFQLINNQLCYTDVLRTYTEHISIQIANAINNNNINLVLLSGGGVKNKFLMSRIRINSNSKLIVPDLQIIDFKEAVIFGFLGVLRMRNEINCYKSVTGAKRDHSTGKIYN